MKSTLLNTRASTRSVGQATAVLLPLPSLPSHSPAALRPERTRQPSGTGGATRRCQGRLDRRHGRRPGRPVLVDREARRGSRCQGRRGSRGHRDFPRDAELRQLQRRRRQAGLQHRRAAPSAAVIPNWSPDAQNERSRRSPRRASPSSSTTPVSTRSRTSAPRLTSAPMTTSRASSPGRPSLRMAPSTPSASTPFPARRTLTRVAAA